MITLKINGKTHQIEVDPMTPLLWVIRENIGLTGTKFGCGIAQCGACTVHIDGKAVRSCISPVGTMEGKEITPPDGWDDDDTSINPKSKNKEEKKSGKDNIGGEATSS